MPIDRRLVHLSDKYQLNHSLFMQLCKNELSFVLGDVIH